MGKTAFIFPGQGSQYVGMGRDLYDSSQIAKKIFDEFNKITGRNISGFCFDGPEEELKQTINTQPSILAVSIACLELLKEKLDIKPAFTAGHSLGEYAALYASGVLTLDDTIKLINKRAELMGKFQKGTMTAVLGLDDAKLAEIIDKSKSFGTISIANYNTPEQTVITGEEKAIEEAEKLCFEAGAKRVIRLAVSGAFHSPLMKDAQDEYKKYLADFSLNDAAIPVVTNTDAKATLKKEEFYTKMASQISSSVYWKQSIDYMVENGVDTFIEIGPGKVLAGMIKRISKTAKVYNISDLASLESTAGSFSLV